MTHSLFSRAFCGCLLCALSFANLALAAESKPLVQPTEAIVSKLKTDHASARLITADAAPAIEITTQADADYPGVHFSTPGGWNLAGSTGVEAIITNPGTSPLTLSVRVDNPGDWRKNPWNSENQTIPAGQTRSARVTFGQSWGNPGFALDPSKIADILIFTDKTKEPRTFLVRSIQAFGSAPAASTNTLAAAQPAAGIAPKSENLLDFSKDDLAKRFAPTSDQVSYALSQEASKPGLVITIQPGSENYPGLKFKPEAAAWDLSSFGHLEAKVTNLGAKSLAFTLRVDNPGEWQQSPWNTESLYLNPGASGIVTLRFGYSYGGKKGYPLNPAQVVNMLFFTAKSSQVQTFRVDSLKVGGQPGEKPPVDPNSVRTRPQDGLIFGPAITIDSAKQLSTKGAVQAALEQKQLKLTFPPAKGEQSAAIKPAIGRWDLRDFLEVRVSLKNGGTTPLTPKLRVESNGGPSDWVSSESPLAPGEEKQFTIPFTAASLWDGAKPRDTGSKLANDAVSAVTFSTVGDEGTRTLLVSAISATMPPTLQLPAWLGQRPPVEGDWVQTFADEFDGSTIDSSKWNVYGENYWDKQSHFSKDNVIVGGGVARLRFEKKQGHQNDDPNHKLQTAYATGFLQTYGKWTQRYGYFESRMKLPTAPGLWPAFWMMPDRGADPAGKDPQWKRQDTKNGGMEFDIMEHLTRWGQNRYNIALHWDGYEKEHKSIGSEKVYFQPDKDGFITAGLLWTPGALVFYSQGKEIGRWENPRISDVPAEIMFTLPMGGWDNNALDDAKLPDDFMIDYVRAWQRRDLMK